jgi:hypothetical protein
MFGILMNPDPALYLDPDQSSAINKVEILKNGRTLCTLLQIRISEEQKQCGLTHIIFFYSRERGQSQALM